MIRTLTSREQMTLRVAIIVALLLVLSNGVPALFSVYELRSDELQQLRDEIARERRLIADQQLWQERRDEAERQSAQLDGLIFSGGTTPLVAAGIQRQIRQIANDAGLIITSTRLAESFEDGGWLMVEQSLSFTLTDQNAILTFLRQLENSQPYLGVTDFSLRRNRNQFTGELTVVGFSRSQSTEADA